MGMIESAKDVVVASEHFANGVATVVYDPALIDLAKTEFLCFTVLIIVLTVIYCVYRCTRLDNLDTKYLRKFTELHVEYVELRKRIEKLEEKRK